MKCIREHELQALVDGELDRRRLSELQAHLEDCGHCRADLENVRGRSQQSREWLSRLDTVPDIAPSRLRAVQDWFFRPLTVSVVCIAALLVMLLVFKLWDGAVGRRHMLGTEASDYMIRIRDDRGQSVLQPIDLDGFSPIADPKLFVFKEV